MVIELRLLAAAAIAYLLLLFLIAHATERRWLPVRLTRNPAIYVLSLGVYATTWSYYGSVGFAGEQGLLYLSIYLGVTLAFLLAPVLLLPILHLTRTYQLSSVADLLAFRFNSQPIGILVTVLMVAVVLPYIAMQVRAVSESTVVLTGGGTAAHWLGLGFVVLVTIFTMIFGAGHGGQHGRHEGLVTAIAFESLMKLLALFLVAAVALSMAFGGLGGLNDWLASTPEALEAFYRPAREGPWASLLVLAFAAGFLLPRQFHMLFTENRKPRHLLIASWGFPLYLLALTLLIPPILWAGRRLELDLLPDYYVLGISLASGSPSLAILAYLGGISAASAMIIVTTLAVSSMLLNHLILPLIPLRSEGDFYGGLRWLRRIVIVGFIGAGYIVYLLLPARGGLVGWGLISFLGIVQLLPAVLALLYWQRATALGVIAGLLGGSAVWAAGSMLPPLLGGLTAVPVLSDALPGGLLGAGYHELTFWSLSVNALLLVAVSLVREAGKEEREAAAACAELGTIQPQGRLHARSPRQFVEQLARVLGEEPARAEVERALRDLGMDRDDSRPSQLHGLRAQIERNLSGMLGPVLARMIVGERLLVDTDTEAALARNARLIEERLETSRTRLRGLAAELDRLRRFHRQIIEDLPVGVCAIGDGGVARWNPALAQITGLPADSVIGRPLPALPAPWGPLFAEFLGSDVSDRHRHSLRVDGRQRWYSLRKAATAEPNPRRRRSGAETVLMVEDLTELHRLEQELAHAERLASIGRLAAGVAHEIGNPVTGISCLAQELRDTCTQREVREQATDILHQAHRIELIVRSLIRYAHAGETTGVPRTAVPLAEAAAEAIRLTCLGREARDIHFILAIDPDLAVHANQQQVLQIFVNLLTNAVDACPVGARVTLSAGAASQGGAPASGQIEVTIQDTGRGIPADCLPRVLEPFYTTKLPGEGTGLGLSLVHNIVTDLGGSLDIVSDSSGTCVRLRLPTAIDPRSPA
jgi:PAS domain S-box-containing protein